MQNPLVDYLRSYGPLAASDSIYDEHVLKAAERSGVRPVEVESVLLNDIVENFRTSSPVSVILTGTAGDGKTWHARNAYARLGGDMRRYRTSEGMVSLMLPSGQELVLIKDLSQFHEDEECQGEILEGLKRAITGADHSKVYLVCANDGQLLRFWRMRSEEDPEVRSIYNAVKEMLDYDRKEYGGLRLRMHNLSRLPHQENFASIVSAVTRHPDWQKCLECEAKELCPIRRNLSLLSADGKATLSSRLGELIRIASDNGTHLPMRHILVLVVNVLLGVSGRKDVTLMTCGTAQKMIEEGEEALRQSNPYDNVVGLNLRNEQHREYIAFSVLEKTGIGLESNNGFDGLLIEKEPEELYRDYVANDPVHGDRRFDVVRKSYKRDPQEAFPEFQKELASQRRRLFFVLPASSAEDDLDPWKLTVFQHGGEYLELCRTACRSVRTKSRLVIGLNRSYTGTMCDDDRFLWLTGPAANTQSRVGRILDEMIPVDDNKGLLKFDFVFDKDRNVPKMSVMVRKSLDGSFREIASHQLSPMLFEYLMRVENGSLPGSFSRQCFEELRQFRLRTRAALQREGVAGNEGLVDLRIVRLGNDGHLKPEHMSIEFEG